MAVAHCRVSSCYNMMNWDFRWNCFCTLFGGMVLACLMKNSDSWWGCFILHTLCSNAGLLWYEMLHEELRLMMDFFFPRSQWISCDLLVPKFLVQDNNISEAAAASLQDQIWLGLWNAAVVFHSLKTDQFVCLLFVVCRFIKIWQSHWHTTSYTRDITRTSLEINSTASVVWSLL
jgi:hypothetical protein